MTSANALPRAGDVVARMERAVVEEQSAPGFASQADGLAWARLVEDLVRSNLRQWDLEDATRLTDASDSEVACAKREIDRLNVDRHRLVQEIDVAIDAILSQPASAPVATESPGMVLDRLSVLVIRRARTKTASVRDTTFAERIPALESQLADLSAAFDSYIDELSTGVRRFVCYESFKLYRPSSAAPASAKE